MSTVAEWNQAAKICAYTYLYTYWTVDHTLPVPVHLFAVANSAEGHAYTLFLPGFHHHHSLSLPV
jgi:hypothetical protein